MPDSPYLFAPVDPIDTGSLTQASMSILTGLQTAGYPPADTLVLVGIMLWMIRAMTDGADDAPRWAQTLDMVMAMAKAPVTTEDLQLLERMQQAARAHLVHLPRTSETSH